MGVAWRLNPLTVVRTGYGLTYNPLPFARPLRGAYPLTIHNTYVSLNSWQPYGTLAQGIPEFTGPGPDEGGDAAAQHRDDADARSRTTCTAATSSRGTRRSNAGCRSTCR